MDKYLNMHAEEKRSKLDDTDKSGGLDNFMSMYVLMQKDCTTSMAAEDARARERLAAEEERALKDAEQQISTTCSSWLFSPHF